MGDIGLVGVRVTMGGGSVDGYNIALGGGFGHDQSVAREIFKGIPFCDVPALLERVLKVYNEKRRSGESFAEFTRRHEVKQLQEMFSD
jgi:ferredoxin-nitrite reductase